MSDAAVTDRPIVEEYNGLAPPRFDSVEAERAHRKDRLVAALRIVGGRGLATGVAGHITVRDPEHADRFWVNPLGTPFTLMTVDDLLLVDDEGTVVVGDKPLNGAAFAIHSAIHRRFPNLNAAAHAHSPNGRPWSATGRLLEPTSQDACAFYETQVVHDSFSGVVLDEDEGAAIAESLAQPTPFAHGNKAASLVNHGHLTVGETVDEAAFWYLLFEKIAGDQLALEATGRPYKVLPHDVASFTRDQTGSHFAGWLGFHGPYAEIKAAGGF